MHVLISIFQVIIVVIFLQSESQAQANTEESSTNLASIQLDLLLNDLPQLQATVVKNNSIWDWLTGAFGNTNEGVKIYWAGSLLPSNSTFDAQCQWNDNNKNAYIKVSRFYGSGPSIGSERRPEEVLFSIVFELNNIKYRDENVKLRGLARAGKISREDYIRAIAKNEYLASQETGLFYRNIWTPFCVKSGLNSNPQIWLIARDISFDQWLSQYNVDSYYPWRVYGEQYDSIRQRTAESSPVGGSSGPVPPGGSDNLNHLSSSDYTKLGIQYLGENLAKEAIEAFTNAITLNHEDADAFNNRAVAERDIGNANASISDCSEAIALNPKLGKAYYNRGLAKYGEGDFSGAIADSNQAIAINPDEADAFNLRGNGYLKIDDLQAALADYDHALAIDPNLFEAYYNRGIVKSQNGDRKGAELDYSAALHLNPKFIQAYSKRGAIKQLEGDLTGASADYDRARNLKKEAADADKASTQSGG